MEQRQLPHTQRQESKDTCKENWCANSGNVASNQEIARLELLTAVELPDFSPNE